MPDQEPRTYPTLDAALKRQEFLSRALGMTPGVVRYGDRWRLTVDPDTSARSHRAADSS